MKILVSGGLGFIGSHTVVELYNEGHEVVIVDDLSNSQIRTLNVLEKITGKTIPFYMLNCTDMGKMEVIFKSHQFDGIIHFAGYKAVGILF
jgi:UDP-glucose 4-epimerase